MSLLQARKINKTELASVDESQGVLLSITDTQELYVNKIDGTQIKITDLVVLDTETQVRAVTEQNESKIYIAREDKSIFVWSSTQNDFIEVAGGLDELEALQTEVATLSTNFSENKTSTQETLDTLNETINTVSTNVATLTSDLSTLDANTTSSINTLTTSITSLTQSVSDTNADITTLNTNVSNLSSSVSTNTTSIESLQASVQSLTTTATSISDKANDNATNISSLTETVSSLSTSVNADKIFNIDFFISDTLVAGLEVDDVFDISTLLTDASTQTIKVESLTVKSLSLLSEVAQLSLVYRTIATDGTVTDATVGYCTLNAGSLIATAEIQEPLSYSDGYFVIKIDEDGGSATNVRLVAKIVRTETTV